MTVKQNAVTKVMNEYVNWGGPIVTRIEAYADGKLRGFSPKMLDYTVFARTAVEAPATAEEAAWHVNFLRRIQLADGLILTID